MATVNAPNYIEQLKNLREQNSFRSLMLQEKLAQSLAMHEHDGLPTQKAEDWKYTPIQKHLPQQISFAAAPGKVTTPSLEKECYHLVMIDGHVDLIHCQLPTKGVNITTFDANSDEIHLPEGSELETYCQTHNEQFNNLNLCSLTQGVLVNIDKNTRLDKPLKITYFKSSANNYLAPRILIKIEDFSQVTLWDHFSTGEAEYFENAVTLIDVGHGAQVKYIKDNSRSLHSTHVGLMQAQVKKDATLDCYYYTSSSQLVRNNISVDLIQENATTNIYGLYACSGKEHADQFIMVNHQAPHTFSDQLFKGVLSGEARGVFTGKVIVHRDAQQVDSSQLNKNLLLSKKAHVDTRPQLEVYADDVKCSHGATVGQLSEDELFYLESRGISSRRAFHMLCEGFAKDVINKIDNPSVARELSKDLAETLKQM